MSSKYRRLVARGRLAAIPIVAAAAVAGGVLGVASASASSTGHAASTISKSTLAKVKADVTAAQQRAEVVRPGPEGQRQEGAQEQDDRDVPDQL